MDEKVDKHQEKLIKDIKENITTLFEKALDYAEVAIPNVDQYKRYRSKILRVGNNCLRDIDKLIKSSYEVKFVSPNETIIETKLGNQVKD